MAENNELLNIRDLSVGFHTYRGDVKAVRGVSISLRQGDILGIVGESVCGKSVTAHAVMGLLPKENSFIAGGSITFNGQDITRMKEKNHIISVDIEKTFINSTFASNLLN